MELEGVIGRSVLHPNSLAWSKPKIDENGFEFAYLAYPAECSIALATITVQPKTASTPGMGYSTTPPSKPFSKLDTNDSQMPTAGLSKHVSFDKKPYVGRRGYNISTLVFSPCDQFIIAGESQVGSLNSSSDDEGDAGVLIFHIETGQRVALLSTVGTSKKNKFGAAYVSMLRVSDDGKVLVACCDSGMFVWDFQSVRESFNVANNEIITFTADDAVFVCSHEHARTEAAKLPNYKESNGPNTIITESIVLDQAELNEPFCCCWLQSNAQIAIDKKFQEYRFAMGGSGFIDVWTLKCDLATNKISASVSSSVLGAHSRRVFVQMEAEHATGGSSRENNQIYAVTDKGILVVLSSNESSEPFVARHWMNMRISSPSAFCITPGALFVCSAGLGTSPSKNVEHLLNMISKDGKNVKPDEETYFSTRLRLFDSDTLKPMGKLNRTPTVDSKDVSEQTLSFIEANSDICCIASLSGDGLKTVSVGGASTTLIAMGLSTRSIVITEFSVAKQVSNSVPDTKKSQKPALSSTPRLGSPLELPSHSACVWSATPVNPFQSFSKGRDTIESRPIKPDDAKFSSLEEQYAFELFSLLTESKSKDMHDFKETLITASDDGTVRMWSSNVSTLYTNRGGLQESSIVLDGDYLSSLSNGCSFVNELVNETYIKLHKTAESSVEAHAFFIETMVFATMVLKRERSWRRGQIILPQSRLQKDKYKALVKIILESLSACSAIVFSVDIEDVLKKNFVFPSYICRSKRAIRSLELAYSPCLQRLQGVAIESMSGSSESAMDILVEDGHGALDWSHIFAGRADGVVSVISPNLYPTQKQTDKSTVEGESSAFLAPPGELRTQLNHICDVPAHDLEVTSLCFIPRPTDTYLSPNIDTKEEWGALASREVVSPYFLTPVPLGHSAKKTSALLPTCPGMLLTASKDGFVHCIDTSDLSMPPLATLQAEDRSIPITSAALLQHSRPFDPYSLSVIVAGASPHAPKLTHLPLPPYVYGLRNSGNSYKELPTVVSTVQSSPSVTFSIAQHPSLKFVAIAGEGVRIRLMSTESGQIIKEHSLLYPLKPKYEQARWPSQNVSSLSEEETAILHISIDPTGTISSLSLSDGRILLMDWVSGALISQSDEHTTPITSSHFSWNGSLLYATSACGCVYVYSLPDALRAQLQLQIKQRILEALTAEASEAPRAWKWATQAISKLNYLYAASSKTKELVKPTKDHMKSYFLTFSSWLGQPPLSKFTESPITAWKLTGQPFLLDARKCDEWLKLNEDDAKKIMDVIEGLKKFRPQLWKKLTNQQKHRHSSSAAVRSSLVNKSLAIPGTKKQDVLQAQGLSKFAAAVLALEDSIADSMSSAGSKAFSAICAAVVSEFSMDDKSTEDESNTKKYRPQSVSDAKRHAPISAGIPRSKISALPEKLIIPEEDAGNNGDEVDSGSNKEAKQIIQVVSARRRAAWALSCGPRSSFTLPEGISVIEQTKEDTKHRVTHAGNPEEDAPLDKSKENVDRKEVAAGVPSDQKSVSQSRKTTGNETKENVNLALSLKGLTLQDDIAESYRFLEENFGNLSLKDGTYSTTWKNEGESKEMSNDVEIADAIKLSQHAESGKKGKVSVRSSFSSLFMQLKELEQEIEASRAESKSKIADKTPISPSKDDQIESKAKTTSNSDTHEQKQKVEAQKGSLEESVIALPDQTPPLSSEKSEEIIHEDIYEDDFLNYNDDNETDLLQFNGLDGHDRYAFSLSADDEKYNTKIDDDDDKNDEKAEIDPQNVVTSSSAGAEKKDLSDIEASNSKISPSESSKSSSSSMVQSSSSSSSKGFFSYDELPSELMTNDNTLDLDLDTILMNEEPLVADVKLINDSDQDGVLDEPLASESKESKAGHVESQTRMSKIEMDSRQCKTEEADVVKRPSQTMLSTSSTKSSIHATKQTLRSEPRISLSTHKNALERLRESVNEVLMLQQQLQQRHILEKTYCSELETDIENVDFESSEFGSSSDQVDDSKDRLEAELAEATFASESTEATIMLYDETLSQIARSLSLALPPSKLELVRTEASISLNSILTSVTRAALNVSQSQVFDRTRNPSKQNFQEQHLSTQSTSDLRQVDTRQSTDLSTVMILAAASVASSSTLTPHSVVGRNQNTVSLQNDNDFVMSASTELKIPAPSSSKKPKIPKLLAQNDSQKTHQSALDSPSKPKIPKKLEMPASPASMASPYSSSQSQAPSKTKGEVLAQRSAISDTAVLSLSYQECSKKVEAQPKSARGNKTKQAKQLNSASAATALSSNPSERQSMRNLPSARKPGKTPAKTK